uniref:Uncharacterized protein n=1 Tax=Caenorhabditis japonica TaxID=281687 RepID=A0A8R1EKL5_CAEJA
MEPTKFWPMASGVFGAQGSEVKSGAVVLSCQFDVCAKSKFSLSTLSGETNDCERVGQIQMMNIVLRQN